MVESILNQHQEAVAQQDVQRTVPSAKPFDVVNMLDEGELSFVGGGGGASNFE